LPLLLVPAMSIALVGQFAIAGTASVASATAPTALEYGLCSNSAHAADCVDVSNAYPTVGWGGSYVGHDEPSLLFYSNRPGSVNNQTYVVRLPKDPPRPPSQNGTGGTDNFMLHPAFWFGMAMCDTQSFPNYTTNCPADSDSNIYNSPDPSSPSYIGKHPGTVHGPQSPARRDRAPARLREPPRRRRSRRRRRSLAGCVRPGLRESLRCHPPFGSGFEAAGAQ
jgi:hypothetical protein